MCVSGGGGGGAYMYTSVGLQIPFWAMNFAVSDQIAMKFFMVVCHINLSRLLHAKIVTLGHSSRLQLFFFFSKSVSAHKIIKHGMVVPYVVSCKNCDLQN